MKNTITTILLFVVTLLSGYSLTAQNEGLDLLNQAEAKFLNAERLSMSLELNIFIPNEPEQVLDGTFIKYRNKFKLIMERMDILSNGENNWFINKEKGTGFIGEVKEEDKVSPLNLIQDFDKSDYDYNLISDYQQDGKTYRAIILKPKARNADYTKIRFLVNKEDNIVDFFLLSRSGERTILKIKDIKYALPSENISFNFHATDYPGIKLEDLRLE